MHIVQTPVRFHPYIGGVENHVRFVSRELVRRGHTVTVVCADEPHVASPTSADGIDVIRLQYPLKIANTNITPRLPMVLMNKEFDALHTYIPTPWSADASAMVSWLKKKPLVLTYENDLVGTGFAGRLASFYNHTFLKKILFLAATIIITQPSYLQYSKFLQQYEYKVEVIPLGVDTSTFKPIPEEERKENTLFFLSVLDQYHSYKGLNDLLSAMQIVKKEIPDVKLIVGGDGALKHSYEQKAIKLGLDSSVEFCGFIPLNLLPRYYAESSCFVLPSTSSAQEGFGIVALEAMACDTPIISTDIVGVAEDVKKYGAGIIEPPNAPHLLADSIISLLQDKERAKNMGANGRRLVEEKYTWGRVTEQIEDVYEELVA